MGKPFDGFEGIFRLVGRVKMNTANDAVRLAALTGNAKFFREVVFDVADRVYLFFHKR